MWSAVASGGGGGGGGRGGAGGGGAGGRAAAPCARAKHSATLLGGHVYVLGGRGAGGAVPLRDFWRYCLGTGSWERLGARGEPPPALQEHSATAHGARLYVFGGEAGALSDETPLWIYDTESEVWSKLSGRAGGAARGRRGGGGAAPRGRRGHSAHALKDCLLVYGGYRDLRGSTNELWAFHYETASWQQVRTATAGPARHRHAAVLHDCRLYVHGGQSDLRACADLWHYDTLSRVWTAVRSPARVSPGARSGHAGLRAGAHFYIFGGEVAGHPTNELWRFHFATETWERIVQDVKWPSARVDCRALLVGGAQAARVRSAPVPAHARARADGFLREISKLSGVRLRRAARCSYTVLAGERDSTESLVRPGLAAARSAYVIDGGAPPGLPRDPTSVPDFADLDSDEDGGQGRGRNGTVTIDEIAPKFADDEAELSTSDYASAERVDRGFSNPHYLGAALTPDSGVGAADIELQDLGERRGARAGERQLHLLLVGGKEPPHLALLQSPLSMWSFKLL